MSLALLEQCQTDSFHYGRRLLGISTPTCGITLWSASSFKIYRMMFRRSFTLAMCFWLFRIIWLHCPATESALPWACAWLFPELCQKHSFHCGRRLLGISTATCGASLLHIISHHVSSEYLNLSCLSMRLVVSESRLYESLAIAWFYKMAFSVDSRCHLILSLNRRMDVNTRRTLLETVAIHLPGSMHVALL